MRFRWFAGVVFAACSLAAASTASAAVIVITQQKAAAGGVTPGDTAGYPITLSVPGAYRLDGNLTVPAGKAGIEIKSHYVNIDMAGFRLYGFNSSSVKVATYGIYGGTFGIVSVRNGAITGFKFSGIAIFNNQWVVEDMTITANGGPGIYATNGSYARFLNNSIFVNGADGILCNRYCHIEGNNVTGNTGGDGIHISSGTVLGNTIFANNRFGIYAVLGGGGVGYGNNTIGGNNPGGSAQVYGPLKSLNANVCEPTAC
jgi:hypothetical protein